MYPSGTDELTGDFEVFWGQWLNTNTTGNQSIHLIAREDGSTIVTEGGWWDDQVHEDTSPYISE